MYKLKLIKTKPTKLFIVRKCFLSTYNVFTEIEQKLILSFINNPENLFKITQINWDKSVRQHPLSASECALISKYLTWTEYTCFLRHYTERAECVEESYDSLFPLRPNSLKLFPLVECSRAPRRIELEIYYLKYFNSIAIAETWAVDKRFLYLRYIYKLDFFKRRTKHLLYFIRDFNLEDVLKIKAYVYKGPGAYKERLDQLNAVYWEFSQKSEKLEEIHYSLIYNFITDRKENCFNRKTYYFAMVKYQGPRHVIDLYLKAKNSKKSCFLEIISDGSMIYIRQVESINMI